MIDEIFNVMKYFPESYINSCRELIISDKGNVYFTASDCKTKEDIISKLLEWCSRPLAKGEPYATNKRNIEWRDSLLCGYNNYLGTNFTQEDMYWIYDKLGNAVNHELTLEFIHSGYDLSLVKPREDNTVNIIQSKINSIKSEIEPQERSNEVSDKPIGKWNNYKASAYHLFGKCSKCGQEFCIDAWHIRGAFDWNVNMKYCPNCGANMDLKENKDGSNNN